MMPHRYTRDDGHSFPKYMWDKYHFVIGYIILTIAIMATIYFTRENLQDQAAQIAKVEVRAGCERDNATRRAVSQNRETMYQILIAFDVPTDLLESQPFEDLLDPVPLIDCSQVGTKKSRQDFDAVNTVLP